MGRLQLQSLNSKLNNLRFHWLEVLQLDHLQEEPQQVRQLAALQLVHQVEALPQDHLSKQSLQL